MGWDYSLRDVDGSRDPSRDARSLELGTGGAPSARRKRPLDRQMAVHREARGATPKESLGTRRVSHEQPTSSRAHFHASPLPSGVLLAAPLLSGALLAAPLPSGALALLATKRRRRKRGGPKSSREQWQPARVDSWEQWQPERGDCRSACRWSRPPSASAGLAAQPRRPQRIHVRTQSKAAVVEWRPRWTVRCARSRRTRLSRPRPRRLRCLRCDIHPRSRPASRLRRLPVPSTSPPASLFLPICSNKPF